MSDLITKDQKESELKEARHMSKHEGESRNSPWTIDVDVYLESVGPPAQFEIESCLPIDRDGNIVFYNRGRPGFLINFHLHDDTGGGYVFPGPPNVSDALWSSEGQGCPPEGCGQWPGFTSVHVKDQGKTLVVRNTNDAQTMFGYTLRVTKDGGSTFVNLDPGGDNQNGSALRGQFG